MVGSSFRLVCMVGFFAALSELLAPPARADEPSAAAVEDQVKERVPPPKPAVPAITTEQLTAFAELVGEPRPVVWQRLQIDPGLLPFAVAAADARMSRKSSGKVRTAVGFSIFGVGLITGYVVMLTSISTDCGYYESDSCGSVDSGRLVLGLVIMAASAGVGLGLGIPGIIAMVRQSGIETSAVERYQYPYLPMPPPAYGRISSAATGYALRVPLLSLSF
jgi:hypothetical protein